MCFTVKRRIWRDPPDFDFPLNVILLELWKIKVKDYYSKEKIIPYIQSPVQVYSSGLAHTFTLHIHGDIRKNLLDHLH